MPEFISVPVPSEYVSDVYALLAKLGGKSAEGPEMADSSGEYWSADDLRALRDCPRASVKHMAQVLDLLSAKPDKPTAFSVIAKALGLTREQLQGQTGGFSRWIHVQWPDHQSSWPIHVQEGTAVDQNLVTETFYSIDQATANIWKQIRGERQDLRASG